MSYEIENYGTPPDDGIRKAGVREPNFPPNYTAGTADADWSNDLQHDPADDDNVFDPQTGWKDGLHIGGTTE